MAEAKIVPFLIVERERARDGRQRATRRAATGGDFSGSDLDWKYLCVTERILFEFEIFR